MIPGPYNYKARTAPGQYKSIKIVLVLSLLFFGLFSVGFTQIIQRTHLAAVAHSCEKVNKRQLLQRRVLRSKFLKDYDVLLLGDQEFLDHAGAQIPPSYKVLKIGYNVQTAREVSQLANTLRWQNSDMIIAQSPITMWAPEVADPKPPLLRFWQLNEVTESHKLVDYNRIRDFLHSAPKCISPSTKYSFSRKLYNQEIEVGTRFTPRRISGNVRRDIRSFVEHPDHSGRKVVFALQPPARVKTNDAKLLDAYTLWASDNEKILDVGDKLIDTRISELFE